MHKEAQQANNDPKSLEVTSKEGADPQLSSVISASNLHKLIYSACFIIHSESALGRDASADSTAEADPGNSAPYDSLPQQQGRDEGTKTIHLITYLKRESTIAKQVEEVSFEDTKFSASPSTEVYKEIKLEDLLKLVEEDDEEVHATSNVETEDTSAPKPLSLRSIQFQELTNQGFAAALAILITRASQSRQHSKSKLDLTSHLPRACLMLAQAGFPSSLGLLKYHSDVLAKSQG
ncbi:hypothetical protein Tco_0432108 [Tanacetum coccineum]